MELIHDGRNGFLTDVDDVPGLTEKINYLLDHPEVCQEMAENNLEAIRPYSFEHQAEVTIQALERFFPVNK